MQADYGSRKDYVEWVADSADQRAENVKNCLEEAFSEYIEKREVKVIVFSDIGASDIAEALLAYPTILKPLLAVCNIGGRAIERDLGIRNINTYNPRIDRDKAMQIGAYIKQFLPAYVEVPSLVRIDRIYFIDKEIRKRKGQWEKIIVNCLNELTDDIFKKRIFEYTGEKFELDAAYPKTGSIAIGIDIKRIEARRDIHKRTDEIVNKARKLKRAYPKSHFVAIIYYPFVDEHINVQNRLKSDDIDEVIFVSQSKDNIRNSCRMLVSSLKERVGISGEDNNVTES